MEDIEAVFIHRDIQIKNRKRNVKADGSPITLITFSLVRRSDRNELLKSGFAKQQENRSKLINGNFKITLKEIRKTQNEIKNLRKEISEFKGNLEFTENELHEKMKKLQEKYEINNKAVDKIYISQVDSNFAYDKLIDLEGRSIIMWKINWKFTRFH